MDKDRIRPIAICLFRHGNRILVCEGYDSSKGDHYCRPLGGGIGFGEPSLDAMLREIQEETGADVERLELLDVIENIFHYEGEQGHEIVFVYDARFTDKRFYEAGEIQVCEEEIGARVTGRWLTLEELEVKNIRLVPEGLTELLAKYSK